MSDARDDESGPAEAEAKPGAAAPAAPEAPAVPGAAAKRKNFRAAAWAISLLVVALALVGTAPYWAPPLLPLLPWGSAPRAQTSALAARLDAAESARKDAEARLGRIEAQLQQQQGAGGAAPSDAAALQPIVERLDALERRVAATSAPDTQAIAQSVQQMGAQLDELDAKIGKLAAAAAGDEGDRTLLAALAELRAAMAGSGPFDGELQGVAALAHGDAAAGAALQPLAGAAATGIPSAALLAERFRAAVAPAILRAAAQTPPAEGDLGDRVLSQIKGLVTIRRIDAGGASGDPAAAAVRAAEGALDKGDLAGAVAALQNLSGAAADAAAPVIAAARQRLDAESAVAGLAQKIMTRLAAGPSPPQESH